MAKRFGVNITRTITIEQTVYVKARDEAGAIEKVQEWFDAGKGGVPIVEIKEANGLAKDAEMSDLTEEVAVEDAYEEEDE